MDTLDFFRELYGQCDRGWLTIWTLHDKRTQWFPVTKLEEAAEAAQRASDHGKDVYFGVGLRREPVYKEKEGWRYLARGENSDVIALPGLWIDIDIASEAHKAQQLPQSIEETLWLFEDFEVKPTIIVHSGNGLHAYWLFDAPWYLNDDNRGQAGAVAELLQRAFQAKAAKRGWLIDNTSDLARVLRVPGTTNYKAEPKPVQVIQVTKHAAEV